MLAPITTATAPPVTQCDIARKRLLPAEAPPHSAPARSRLAKMLASGPRKREAGQKGAVDAIKDGAFPPIDEKTRAITPYVMIGSSLAMMLVMCVGALIISLLVIALAPPPGQVDHPEDMPWTKQAPWNVSHGEQRPPQNLQCARLGSRISSAAARHWVSCLLCSEGAGNRPTLTPRAPHPRLHQCGGRAWAWLGPHEVRRAL